MLRAITIPKSANLIVVPHHAVVLSLHHHPDSVWQLSLEGLAIAILSKVFASFALLEDRDIGTTRDACLQMDPTAMHRAGDAAAFLRFAAKLRDQLLQVDERYSDSPPRVVEITLAALRLPCPQPQRENPLRHPWMFRPSR